MPQRERNFRKAAAVRWRRANILNPAAHRRPERLELEGAGEGLKDGQSAPDRLLFRRAAATMIARQKISVWLVRHCPRLQHNPLLIGLSKPFDTTFAPHST